MRTAGAAVGAGNSLLVLGHAGVLHGASKGKAAKQKGGTRLVGADHFTREIYKKDTGDDTAEAAHHGTLRIALPSTIDCFSLKSALIDAAC